MYLEPHAIYGWMLIGALIAAPIFWFAAMSGRIADDAPRTPSPAVRRPTE